MDYNITPFLPEQSEKKTAGEETKLRPCQETIAFLQLFARNYQVEKRLPAGLQEFIIG